MQTFLKINNLDVSALIKEGGITQSEFVRQSRQVVTLAGHLEKSEVVKRRIDVQLLELRDEKWQQVCDALSTRPVTVSYVDDAYGVSAGRFHVGSVYATTQTVVGGNTYYSGASFSLEEV